MERIREELTELGSLSDADACLSYFYDDSVSLQSYFSAEDTVYVIDEPNRVEERARAFTEEYENSMKARLEGGYILPGQMNRICSFWRDDRKAGTPAVDLYEHADTQNTIYQSIASI